MKEEIFKRRVEVDVLSWVECLAYASSGTAHSVMLEGCTCVYVLLTDAPPPRPPRVLVAGTNAGTKGSIMQFLKNDSGKIN